MQNVIYTKNSRLHKYKQYYTKGSIVVICGNEIIKKYKLIYNEIVSLASKNNKVLVITSYRNENRKESGVSFILNSIETLDFNIKNNITMKSIYYEQPVSIPIKFDIKSFEIKDKYDYITSDIANTLNNIKEGSTEEKIAFLKGIFLSCGSINDPKKNMYHLEFLIKDYCIDKNKCRKPA